MNYSEFRGLGWRVLTNFGTETITHNGAINGWNAFAAFIPTKQIGFVALFGTLLLVCSCDAIDFVLLHLAGVENINGKSERFLHTTPGTS